MSDERPFLRFPVGACDFLKRAEEQRARYKREASVEAFLYAALNLRFGIEARLNEYLRPALRSIGKESKDISEYVASKLLKRLVSIDPDAGRASTLRLTSVEDGHETLLEFTPVSQRLAAIHGQLGELLHYKFFTNNENWMVKKALGGNPHRSVSDFLPLLDEGIAELRQATSGSLLSNPRFTQLVQDVAEELADKHGTAGS